MDEVDNVLPLAIENEKNMSKNVSFSFPSFSMHS